MQSPAASVPDATATSTPPPKFYGCTEPRIWTPPLRELTPETSLGFDVIEFAEQDLGVVLHPYQRWLYIHALELLENGEFRFRTIIILIARQNGKTHWWKILVLYAMYVLGMKLVLSTAQDLDTAEGTWQEVVDWVMEQDDDEEFVHPDLAEVVKNVVQVNGKKALQLRTGEQYKAKAPNRKAGRGKSAQLVGLDELREHQTWASWSAITHTTMAQARALHIGLSNAGDLLSVVLKYFRKVAHAALGDPDGINAAEDPSSLLNGLDQDDLDDLQLEEDDESLGIFEYSAAPGCAINDWAGIAQANPSLNHPHGIGERAVRAAMKEPEWEYRTEVLCQWPSGALEGPFPAGGSHPRTTRRPSRRSSSGSTRSASTCRPTRPGRTSPLQASPRRAGSARPWSHPGSARTGSGPGCTNAATRSSGLPLRAGEPRCRTSLTTGRSRSTASPACRSSAGKAKT